MITRGDTVGGPSAAFAQSGLAVEQWYGVRVFTDHLEDGTPDEHLPEILALEWEDGKRDPYRSVGRLIYVIGRNNPV